MTTPPMPASHPGPSFEPGRRYRTGFSVVVSVVSLMAIIAMLNFWAVTRFVIRYDVRGRDQPALSPLTLQTLAALTNDVKVSVIFNPAEDLFPHVDSLLREYAVRSPHVRVEVIDYVRNPGAALKLLNQYKLGAGVNNLVIFDAGGTPRVVTASEMSLYNQDDTQAIMTGEKREIRRSGFAGEYHFTSALAALQSGEPVKVGYLLGHNEHPPDSQEPVLGYASFMKLLTGEKNLAVETLNLAGVTNGIPADMQLLIIAGPTGPLLSGEIAKIEAFLQRGGRLLALLHPYSVEKGTGLEGLLQRWGIAAPPGFAGDEQFTLTKLDVISKSFGSHPIVLPLRREGGALYFPFPRIVAPIPADRLAADAPRAETLVETSREGGFTRSDVKNGNAGFDPARDQKGVRVPLAVAAEKGGVAGIASGRGATRIVAIGDSTMFANTSIGKPGETANNHDFANLAVSWLLDRPQSLAIGPKPIREYRLHLTETQLGGLRWILLGGLPGGVLLVGFVVWFRRRS